MKRFLLVGLIVPAVLSAQAAPRAVGGSLDLGYVSTQGNTDLTSFSLGERLGWKVTSALSIAQSLRSIYANANDSVTASSFTVLASADYTLVHGIGATVGGGYDRDRFAGIARRYYESVGAVWKGASAAHDSLRLEGGAVWTQQRGVDSISKHFTSARAAIWYKRPLSTGAYVQEAFEVLPNLDTPKDWRLNSETALVAPISKQIGLKAAYVVKYENVPEPTFKKSDRILTVGVQISY